LTGGHFHWNWGRDGLRTLVLNAISWLAGIDIPESGIPSRTPMFEELTASLGQPSRYRYADSPNASWRGVVRPMRRSRCRWNFILLAFNHGSLTKVPSQASRSNKLLNTCVVDGNLVSGRTYHDHGHYVGVWLKMLIRAGALAQQSKQT